MKWYWAIFFTVVIIGCTTVVLKIGGNAGIWFVQFVVAITAIWAAGKSSSVGWGVFVYLLWPIGFPCFLIREYRQPSAKVEGPDFLECPRCNKMIPPGEQKCPKCGWE